MAQTRLENIDLLRAIAALTVCFAHFNALHMMGDGLLSDFCFHGYLGVDIFFVISGFVIPLSLLHTKYKIGDLKTFLVSRFLRLYPAYLTSIAIVLGLWYLATLVPGFRGNPPSFTLLQLASNMLFICGFNGEGWFIDVFWTLAIEAQYYVLIAISFPVLFSPNPVLRRGSLILWIVAPVFVSLGSTVFAWAPLFALGITAFLRKEKKVGLVEFVIALIAAAALQTYARNWHSGLVGVITALIILYLPNLRVGFLAYIGKISYSLYLIHLPISIKVSNLSGRLPDAAWVKPLSAVASLCLSLVAAGFLFYFIEKPSHQLARRARRRNLFAGGFWSGGAKEEKL